VLGQDLDHQPGRGLGGAGRQGFVVRVVGQFRRRDAAEHHAQHREDNRARLAAHAQLQHDVVQGAGHLLRGLAALLALLLLRGRVGGLGDAGIADAVQALVEHREQRVLRQDRGDLGPLDQAEQHRQRDGQQGHVHSADRNGRGGDLALHHRQLEGPGDAGTQPCHQHLSVGQQHRLVLWQALRRPLAVDDGVQHLQVVLALVLYLIVGAHRVGRLKERVDLLDDFLVHAVQLLHQRVLGQLPGGNR
jgi:hypothetical protein